MMRCKPFVPQTTNFPPNYHPLHLLTCTRDIELGRDSHRLAGPSSLGNRDIALAVVVRDSTNWLSYMRTLRETDVIILLTPVVVPISQDPTDISDPFEPLGRSLARRHARVRQVPYTQRFEHTPYFDSTN